MTLYYVIDNEPDWDSECNSIYLMKHYKPLELEFEVEVDFNDFFEFMQPNDFKSWHEEGKKAFKIACEKVWNSNWFNSDDLEEDEDFIEFMKDKYEETALDGDYQYDEPR